MSIVKQNARMYQHRITGTGSTPTIPFTEDFTDGSWLVTDIGIGEFMINATDNKAWFRSSDGIHELITASSSTSNFWTEDVNHNLYSQAPWNIVNGSATLATFSAVNILNGTFNVLTGTTNENFINGNNNTVGSFDNIVNGDSNITMSPYSLINGTNNIIYSTSNYNSISGDSNIIGTNSYGSVVEGDSNTISNNVGYNYINGYNNIAAADNTKILGDECITTTIGEVAFNAAGGVSSQYGFSNLYTSTTNATPTRLSIGLNNFNIPSGSAYAIEVTVIGGSSVGDSTAFTATGIIKNVAGTTSLVAAITAINIATDASLSTASVAITADNSTDTLNITVTGVAATNINWNGVVKYTKIIF